jgi:hypothetical protein
VPAPSGNAFAVAPGSPENAKVVNAALRGKDATVTIARTALPHAGRSWPAGTIFLDAEGARAAANVLPDSAVEWVSVDSVPTSVEKLRTPRVGLYKPWAASMDEGWTRWVLEQYGFEPKPIDNKTIRAGRLAEKFDAIVLPDVAKEIIASGRPKVDDGEMRYFADLPAEYAGGLEKEGAKAVNDFVAAGGTLVAFDSSSDWVIENFNIPVRNALYRAKPDEFSSAGALVRIRVTPGHPVTYGLPDEVAAFVDDATVFATGLGGAELERWVLAAYPESARDVLLSGWIRGEDRLVRRAAAVATTYGKGKIVLLGFRPQHRAQTHATFPFLFNALYWSTAK